MILPAQENSFKLTTYGVSFVPVLGGLKTANYWPNLLGLKDARQRGFDEALLFNPTAHLVSGCMANVFVVQNGVVRTPAASSGARAGVVREWVMKKRQVEETFLTIKDLETADEIFLTNSGLGVISASFFDHRPLPTRTVATELQVEYVREIGEVA